ncbi:MAG: Ig-like domain-containing protein [Lachnospiraceae bacterium]|nr:Ig-like domain-containing protein [Lachnospiraceae bacterium]
MTGRNKKTIFGLLSMAAMIFILNGCQRSTGMNLNQLHTLVSEETKGVADLWKTRDLTLEAFQVAEDTIHLRIDETTRIELKMEDSQSALYGFVFSSSDEKVCKVTQDGTVLGVGPGDASITIEERFSDWKKEITVRVEEGHFQEILLSSEEVSLKVGEETMVQATVVPGDTEETEILWSSNDESVAVVSQKGSIKAIAQGECVITATLQSDDRIKAELRVQVLNPAANGNSNQGTGNTNSGINENSNGGTGGNSGSGNPGSIPGQTGNSNSGVENSGAGETGTVSNAYYVDSYAEQVLGIVNARRAEAGLSPLTMNYTLVSAAKVRAAEIVQSFSHTRPNGTSCFTAWDEAGVGYSGAGENIAGGQWSAESAMNAWMNSEGHRANILNGSFTQIGIACYYDPDSPYGYYWVQCFIY